MELFYIYLVLSLIFTIVISLYPYSFGNYLNLIDFGKSSNLKIHKNNVSKIGGLILFILLLNYFFYNLAKNYIDKNLIFIFFYYFGFLFIGLLDDYLNIKPLTRIILYSFVCFVFLSLNNNVVIIKFFSDIFDQFFYTKPISMFFTIFCFIFLQNILNMLDGINGSLLSYSIAVIIILLFISFSYFALLLLLILFLLLVLNLQNKIFLGNNGSSIISSIVGLLIISIHQIKPEILSAEKIIIILFIPFIDLLRLFIIRIINNKNPFKGDLNHFHHLVLSKFNQIIWIPVLILYIIFSYSISLLVNSFLVIIVNFVIYLIFIKKFNNK